MRCWACNLPRPCSCDDREDDPRIEPWARPRAAPISSGVTASPRRRLKHPVAAWNPWRRRRLGLCPPGWAYAVDEHAETWEDVRCAEVGHWLGEEATEFEHAWWVKLYAGDGEARLDVATPEQAVTVAHLLVAAEQIASGAEVAPPRDHGVVGDPASARRAAIDLLNAAAEAEVAIAEEADA